MEKSPGKPKVIIERVGGTPAQVKAPEPPPRLTGSQATDDDQTREAAAYNQSIYLMVATPYLALSVFGFFVYRSLRKRSAAPAAPFELPPVSAAPSDGVREVVRP